MFYHRIRNSPIITCTVADGWNGIDTITTITAQSGANSGYNNASRIILDGSYGTNASNGAYASTILFQSINSGGWKNNVVFKTLSDSSTRVGIANNTPQSMLHIGNSEVVGSAPVILFGKNNGSGSRNAFMGYADSFFLFLVIMEVQMEQIH